MKYVIFISIILVTKNGLAQERDLNQYQHYFARELHEWVNTFKSFQLSEFQRKDSLSFDNSEPQDFRTINSFLSILKPILTFNQDSTRFIDIYSGQANISKEGDHFVANSDDGGAIFLCNIKSKYWNRIFYNSISLWIEEAVWVSKNKFILAGITKNEKEERMPLILVGDAVKHTLCEYMSNNNSCIQKKTYSSLKLKKMDIRGW
jgi:hypothetical protein